MKTLEVAGAGAALDLTALVGSQVPSAVLVTEVEMCAHTTAPEGWVGGPLPVLQAMNATALQRGFKPSTDEAARRTLVASQQGDALYGCDGVPVRFHRIVRTTANSDPILAIELLLAPSEVSREGRSRGWLVVHVGAPTGRLSDPAATRSHLDLMTNVVRGAARFEHEFWRSAQALLPGDVQVCEGGQVRTLSFQTLNVAGESARRCRRSRRPDAHQESLIAAYLLVTSATEAQVADLSRRARLHSLTIERPDWSALVLREGAAFVAHQTGAEPFSDVLRVQSHTIHLDAMLLALLQRGMVDASGARTVEASLKNAKELVDLEQRHFDFKRKYWRTSLTYKRNSPSDEILRAFQAELLTALDVADVQERVQEGAQLARSLNAESQNLNQQKLTRLVQYATVIFGALGLTFTAAPVISDPSWGLFVIAAAVGMVAMVLALLVLRMTGRHSRSTEGSDAPG